MEGAVEVEVALALATAAVVVAGSAYDPRRRTRNEVLGRTGERADLDELAAAAAAGGFEARTALTSPSSPSIALLQGRELLGCLGVVGGPDHPDLLRWPGWPCDGHVLDPPRLAAWLAAVTGAP